MRDDKYKAKWQTSGGHGIEVEHHKKEMVDELVEKAEAKGFVVTRCGPGESLSAPPKAVKKVVRKKKVTKKRNTDV